MARSDCISDQDLQAFVRGDLPERLTERVARHLELCPECEERAGRWDNLPDTAVQALRGQEREQTLANQTDADSGVGRLDIKAIAQMTANSPSPDGYTLLHELGKGGMGVVFQARQHQPERLVALKFFSAGVHAAEERARFLAEANIIARLDHPNIVRVHAVGEHQGQPFLCLEYLEGGHLGKKINGQPQPPRQAARLLEQLAWAVHHAHEKGVIHRDLKPANVLLTADGTPKVTDFGLARYGRPELTATGAVMGTPAYMAPEQARGEGKIVGPAADIWALGVILYELLTGQPPFRGVQVMDTLMQVVESEPVPPRRLQPKVPRDLETICLKCLQKRPPRRHGTAAALAEDLRRYLDGRPIQARPVGNLERAAKWVRRRPAAAALLALTFLVVCAVAVAAFWYQQDRANREKEELQRQAEEAKRQTEDIRREAGRKLRHDRNEQAIAAALAQAKQIREELHGRLAKPGGVARLLNRPGEWQQLIATMRANLKTARELQTGAEGSVADKLRRQLAKLKSWVAKDEADRQLAWSLEKVREDSAATLGHGFNFGVALQDYPQLFQKAGLGPRPGQENALAARLRQSPIKEQLVAALDDWALASWRLNDQQQLYRYLLSVARLADPDPWKDKVRNADTWSDREALNRLAGALLKDHATLAHLSPQMLSVLGMLLPRDTPEGLAWRRRAQAAHPTDFWLALELATTYLRAKSPKAESAYRTALAIRPTSIAAWNNLGSVLRRQKDQQGAEDCFRKMLDLDPKSAFAWTHLGSLRLAQMDWTRAEQCARKAVAFGPQFAEPWATLGIALSYQRKGPEAVQCLLRAVKLDPNMASSWYVLGELQRTQGQREQAEKSFRKSLELDPKQASCWNGLGLVLMSRKDYVGAEDCFGKSLEIDRNFYPAQANLLLVRTLKNVK
jgi:serine/threonine-protein kinase